VVYPAQIVHSSRIGSSTRGRPMPPDVTLSPSRPKIPAVEAPGPVAFVAMKWSTPSRPLLKRC
jgi:hypothetical protein